MSENETDPHEVDENPEELIGEALPDPWASDEDADKDWPNEEVTV